ncbi:hypothetical protein H696_05671 [Fonticula alba]|uniref:Uncharacterized protein n=1 Tax=Fonticula alba TaxID=691883 RepID=A0A058Z1F0_FONAL|nr:hypothetical protein H696_05671 [Fonticula alba]KCV67946.1 hypothetical protein H696_05671 [Fonticula alba]|eukprot:XP_009497766.1 hypothetical protein H696_05671 [Fonticula alba]
MQCPAAAAAAAAQADPWLPASDSPSGHLRMPSALRTVQIVERVDLTSALTVSAGAALLQPPAVASATPAGSAALYTDRSIGPPVALGSPPDGGLDPARDAGPPAAEPGASADGQPASILEYGPVTSVLVLSSGLVCIGTLGGLLLFIRLAAGQEPGVPPARETAGAELVCIARGLGSVMWIGEVAAFASYPRSMLAISAEGRLYVFPLSYYELDDAARLPAGHLRLLVPASSVAVPLNIIRVHAQRHYAPPADVGPGGAEADGPPGPVDPASLLEASVSVDLLPVTATLSTVLVAVTSDGSVIRMKFSRNASASALAGSAPPVSAIFETLSGVNTSHFSVALARERVVLVSRNRRYLGREDGPPGDSSPSSRGAPEQTTFMQEHLKQHYTDAPMVVELAPLLPVPFSPEILSHATTPRTGASFGGSPGLGGPGVGREFPSPGSTSSSSSVATSAPCSPATSAGSGLPGDFEDSLPGSPRAGARAWTPDGGASDQLLGYETTEPGQDTEAGLADGSRTSSSSSNSRSNNNNNDAAAGADGSSGLGLSSYGLGPDDMDPDQADAVLPDTTQRVCIIPPWVLSCRSKADMLNSPSMATDDSLPAERLIGAVVSASLDGSLAVHVPAAATAPRPRREMPAATTAAGVPGMTPAGGALPALGPGPGPPAMPAQWPAAWCYFSKRPIFFVGRPPPRSEPIHISARPTRRDSVAGAGPGDPRRSASPGPGMDRPPLGRARRPSRLSQLLCTAVARDGTIFFLYILPRSPGPALPMGTTATGGSSSPTERTSGSVPPPLDPISSRVLAVRFELGAGVALATCGRIGGKDVLISITQAGEVIAIFAPPAQLLVLEGEDAPGDVPELGWSFGPGREGSQSGLGTAPSPPGQGHRPAEEARAQPEQEGPLSLTHDAGLLLEASDPHLIAQLESQLAALQAALQQRGDSGV